MLDADFFDGAVAFGPQDILHLHRLDDRQGLAGLDLLPFGHRQRNDQARHRAAHGLFAAGELLGRHQPRVARFALGINERLHLDAAIGELEAIRDHSHVHGDWGAIERARPDRYTGSPCRRQSVAVAVLELSGDRIPVVGDVGVKLFAAERNRPPAFAGDGVIELAGNTALALPQYVIDRRGDAGDRARHRAGRRRPSNLSGTPRR